MILHDENGSVPAFARATTDTGSSGGSITALHRRQNDATRKRLLGRVMQTVTILSQNHIRIPNLQEMQEYKQFCAIIHYRAWALDVANVTLEQYRQRFGHDYAIEAGKIEFEIVAHYELFIRDFRPLQTNITDLDPGEGGIMQWGMDVLYLIQEYIEYNPFLPFPILRHELL